MEASRRIEVPWRRCKRSIDGWMVSREDGVDWGNCWFSRIDDDLLISFDVKSIGIDLSTAVLIVDAMKMCRKIM